MSNVPPPISREVGGRANRKNKYVSIEAGRRGGFKKVEVKCCISSVRIAVAISIFYASCCPGDHHTIPWLLLGDSVVTHPDRMPWAYTMYLLLYIRQGMQLKGVSHEILGPFFDMYG